MKKEFVYIALFVASLLSFSCSDLNDFDKGNFNGRVFDATTGEGLADVDVTLDPVLTANGNAVTKPDGYFNLSRLVAGDYTVRIKKNGASLIDVAEDQITLGGGNTITKEYKLTPRVSVSDFSVDYDKADPTKFTVNFKATGNEGNKFAYYAVMWDLYPNYIFSKLPAAQKKTIKFNATKSADVSYEVTGVTLKNGATYYIRVGVTHLVGGGDYNHSNIVMIKFE